MFIPVVWADIASALGRARSQIFLATLRNVELIDGDGSVPYPWPIEMDDHENSAFLASPALHDVDGDGVQVHHPLAQFQSHL